MYLGLIIYGIWNVKASILHRRVLQGLQLATCSRSERKHIQQCRQAVHKKNAKEELLRDIYDWEKFIYPTDERLHWMTSPRASTMRACVRAMEENKCSVIMTWKWYGMELETKQFGPQSSWKLYTVEKVAEFQATKGIINVKGVTCNMSSVFRDRNRNTKQWQWDTDKKWSEKKIRCCRIASWNMDDFRSERCVIITIECDNWRMLYRHKSYRLIEQCSNFFKRQKVLLSSSTSFSDSNDIIIFGTENSRNRIKKLK